MRMTEDCGRLRTLAATVWAERHLVEELLFKLVATKLVLADDDRRFVSRAFDEVEQVADRLWGAAHDRDAAVAAVAAERGQPADELTLAALAATSPEPWASMFEDHLRALHGMVGEIEHTVTHSRSLTDIRLRSVRDTLGAPAARRNGVPVGVGSETVGATSGSLVGPQASETVLELHIQELAYEAAWWSLARPLPPTALRTFLGATT